jgi:hypothetical protein
VRIGKQQSLADRRELGTSERKELIYGEMYYKGVAQMFEFIEAECGGLPDGGVFYDLGSGLGKV